ncbi:MULTISPECIES: radical SAM protein [unclassified Pseudoalteromonas]|uniref:radical SAM protein n=1 Tax=unclassified Pseudoalteromonas TaxID=194690 RepID=UPI001F1635A3|nr:MULTISPECIES: radical SAM protein [unclassified Pseudoalteromonas]MCF2826594.1 radical SAM protein [Pseudoalteromonas sp. OF5H-5]MCF2926070.1 radical SAM protein [Pseudoalteromonas sp. DL2-H1]
MKSIKHLEIILKTTERCNINCDYCYVFNLHDSSYKERSARINLDTIESLVTFTSQAISDYGIEVLDVILHGGEPLLMPRNHFIEICEKLKSFNSIQVNLALQTNATLIDESWVSIFEKYDIALGVSLDGPQEINDKHRVDHNEKGSFDKVIKGIEKLKDAESQKRIRSFGLLCVIDPYESPSDILKFFTRELSANSVSFLLPMDTHDTYNKKDVDKLSNYLINLFDSWVEEFENNNITIRIFSEIINTLTKDLKHLEQVSSKLDNSLMIGISSDGEIIFDELRGLNGISNNQNIKNHSLSQYISSEAFVKIEKQLETLPYECAPCVWKGLCKGGVGLGAGITRHSKLHQFKNKSILCDSFRALFAHIVNYLIASGFSVVEIERNLDFLGDSLIIQSQEVINSVNLQ